MRVLALLVLLTPLTALAAPTETGAARVKPDGRTKVLDAASAEIDRAMTRLKLGDNGPPFFIGVQVKEFDSREVEGKFGALYEDASRRYRSVFADVRVGSYQLDSSPEGSAFDFDFDDAGWRPDQTVPLDDDPHALRTALWLVIDDQYKRALASYLKKRGQEVTRPDDPDHVPSFSREKPVVFLGTDRPLTFDHRAWAKETRRVTRALEGRPGVFDGEMKVTADRVVRSFVSSEGTRLVTTHLIYGLHVDAYARAPDGMLLTNSRDYYGATEAELPRGAALDGPVRRMLDELVQLEHAPLVDPFTGPALLSAQATGVLFHEAIGHRLEGDREDDSEEGHTFKGQVGNLVLPPFVSVLDDPTERLFDAGGQKLSLNGFYRFDEQGVPAQKVTLVDHGVLRTFLLSRHPVPGFLQSNGHGRASGDHRPVARMGNLLVLPAKTVPDARLKQMLVDLARAQHKPYGIYIEDVTGGNTNTAHDGYQAFKGMSRLVYRVRASDGKEELVRGVELVGTPLASVNSIVAMGDKPGVFNGYCGAESGYVPVSTVAPEALLSELELERSRKHAGRPPILPAP